MAISSFLLYIFITSFTPGPNNIMAMYIANQFGFKKALRFSYGVGAGFLILILASSFFNVLLQNYIPKVELVMTILGVIYILYLALKIVNSEATDSNSEQNINRIFTTGMILQFVNPKGILYALTAIGTFIVPHYEFTYILISFSIFLAFVGFLGTIFWALFGTVFQSFLAKYRRHFNIVMALLLLYSAASLVINF